MTRFQLHVLEWKDCTRCSLHETRTRVCLYRGETVRCDVLFVGEAPGVSEDVLGRPFVGPAGELLDRIVRRAVPDGWRVGYTNLVGCMPVVDGDKRDPDDESVRACAPRLVDLVSICRPKLVVCVGKLAKTWLNTPMSRDAIRMPIPVRFVDVVHPAAILRASFADQGMMVQRAVVAIADAVDDLSGGESPP